MPKTILLTGATDGLGLETAKRLAARGHLLLLHGRSDAKLTAAQRAVAAEGAVVTAETFRADLSDLAEVDALADAIAARHARLDVLINNAGVLKTRAAPAAAPGTPDLRFIVNAIAPYRLTRRLLPLMRRGGRIVNLSSAAQAGVSLSALGGRVQAPLPAFEAYAQSKLALTMWTRHLADEVGAAGPAVIAVNPGSFLGTKMVRDGFGVSGVDVGIGAEVIVRAALGDEFEGKSGAYFNNDVGAFSSPHKDAADAHKNRAVVERIEEVLARFGDGV